MKNLILCLCMLPGLCWAWGRRGHQIVAESAALAASAEPESSFLRNHSFDLGYYANVPDFIWKRPATYDKERNEHFMDLEIFEVAFKKQPEVKDPLALSRKEFEAKFPEVKSHAGRAFWRIREMNDQLTEITKQLKALKDDAPAKERQALQEKWMVLAGTMSHYVGDLGMPLHLSENYDGQLTGQKGIHSYFEDTMVDLLYPEIGVTVQKRVAEQWPAFKTKNADKPVLALLQELSANSRKAIDPMLKIDKANKRDPTKNSAKKFEKLIAERLADASLYLAELYRRQTGFKFDDHKFYFFAGEPAHIPPGDLK